MVNLDSSLCSLCLPLILLFPVTQGTGFPNVSEITDSSLLLSRYVNHSGTFGHWQLFPFMSFSCDCSIFSWSFIATEMPQVDNGEHLKFQIWHHITNLTLAQVASIPIKRSSIKRLAPMNSMRMSLVELNLDNPVKVSEGDIFGLFQPNSEKSELILQFQRGLAPAHYLHPTNTPTSEFAIRGTITVYDYPLVAVQCDCSRECVNGFPTSGSVERFFSTNFNSNLINHSGLNRVMSALNFTCATSITRVSVGAKKVFGASWPQIEFWETTLPRPDVYSRILSLTLTNATAAPSPGVFEYIPPKPLPISANNILSLYEPTDSVLKVYSEQDSDMFPPSFYLPRSDGMEQTVLYDNDRPLLSIDTADERCTNGFITHSNLVRKSLSLALVTVYNTLYVVPDMKFPETGNVTKILFSGQYLDTTGSNSRQYYPEIHIWRLQDNSGGLGGDTYRKVGKIGYRIAPVFSEQVNVYQYKLEIPLSVQEGDVLGYYQPPSSESLMGLVSIEDRGQENYFLYGQNPDTITLSSPTVGKSMRTPLINFQYDFESMPPENDNQSGNDDNKLPLIIGVTVGGVVGGLLIAGLVVGVVFLFVVWVKGRRRGRGKGKDSGGDNIQNPTYDKDNVSVIYTEISEIRRPLPLPPSSPSHHLIYYTCPARPYELPTISRQAGTQIDPEQHSYNCLEFYKKSRMEFAARLNANLAGKSPVRPAGVELAQMRGKCGGSDVVNENGTHKDHEPSKIWSKKRWGLYVPTEEQRTSINISTQASDHLYADPNKQSSSPVDNGYNDHLDSECSSEPVFFQEEQCYWRPASDTRSLYKQLSCKKYRELPKHHVRISKHLGSGQFGTVSRGVWSSTTGSIDVAVKTLKPASSEVNKVKFLQEAAINGQFHHPNIVKLIGVVTIGQPVMIVLELMSNGDLRNHLLQLKPNLSAVKRDLSQKLLRFCQDVASGMAYLAGKSFVHRDLAARNILMSYDFTCKISDFGMSRDLEEETYYVSTGGKIPIKWTAPEAIHYKKYSTASDVWSYGMVMYEIWSLGQKPFSEFTNSQTVSLLERAFCLPPPPGTPREIYSLMVHCWHPDQSSRPTFPGLRYHLSLPVSQLLHWSTEDAAGVGPRAIMLGAPLKTAHTLHMNLQNSYTTH